MTSQSISELSSFFTGSIGTQAASKMKGSDQSFSGLMNRETQADANAPTESASKAAPRKATEVRKPDQVKDFSKADRTKKIEAADGMNNQVMDRTKEIADQITGEMKQMLNVTDEEISTAMESLGLSMMDLLDPNALQQLFTALSGAEDSMALLTNEELYSQLEQLTELTEGLLNDLQKELGISNEEFDSLMAQVSAASAEEGNADAREIGSEKREETPVILQDERADQANGMTDASAQSVAQVSKDEKPSAHTDHNAEDAQNQLGNAGVAQLTENLSDAITEAVDHSSFSSYVDAQEITNQVIEQVKVRISEETTSMEMQLNPESLGRLSLTVESRNGILSAQISAQEEAVKVAIEGQIELLKQTLEEQGLKVEAVEVSVAAHEFEQNLEQGRDQAQQEEDAKIAQVGGRKRNSINLLSEDEEEGEEEELDEAEAINRDMMIRNGNTVDYTA